MSKHTINSALAILALPFTIANSQVGTITYYQDVFGSLANKGIFDNKCHDLEPEQHSCWNSGKLYCDYNYTCINKNCIKPKPNNNLCDNLRGNAAYNVAPVRVNGEVNFYADVSKNGCQETDYDTSTGTESICIQVRGFRISCRSDLFEDGKDYSGIIVYDRGTYPSSIWPGYTMFMDTSLEKRQAYIDWHTGDDDEISEGMVHGYGVWRRFNENPSTLHNKYGMKFAGFAYRDGILKFNSGTLNYATNWELKQRNLVKDEEIIVKALFLAWKTNGIAKSYYADESSRRSLIPWICKALTELSTKKEAQAFSRSVYPQCKDEVDNYFP